LDTATKLKVLQTRYGISRQDDFARILGIYLHTLSDIYAGRVEITAKCLNEYKAKVEQAQQTAA
jgi:plasmid maintenance system antidote protein VapI